LRLPEGEARHVLQVLRGRAGSDLEVVDADRRIFAAVLQRGGEAAILEALEAPDEDV
jgi:hypothetical protein